MAEWANRVKEIERLGLDAKTVCTQRDQVEKEREETGKWVVATLMPYCEALTDLYEIWRTIKNPKTEAHGLNGWKIPIKVAGQRLDVRCGDVEAIYLGDHGIATVSACPAHQNWVVTHLKELEAELQRVLDEKTDEVKEVIKSEKQRVRREAELLDPIRVLMKMKEGR